MLLETLIEEFTEPVVQKKEEFQERAVPFPFVFFFGLLKLHEELFRGKWLLSILFGTSRDKKMQWTYLGSVLYEKSVNFWK